MTKIILSGSPLQVTIGFGLCLILLIGIWLNVKFNNQRFSGDTPSSSTALFAILFTSGLDSGFILLPLLEFEQYQADIATYGFSNPLAIELGFWGFTAWAMYYVSALYFLTLEPKYRWFEKPFIKRVNGIIVLTTCAFTLSLFLQLLPSYISVTSSTTLTSTMTFILLACLIIFALKVSESVRLMTRLSQLSMVAFFCLAAYLLSMVDFTVNELTTNLLLASDYLNHLPKFVLPFNDYHEFYLAWWLTWSIMLGQFVARFVKQLTPLKLLGIMTIVPMVPCLLWFSILYGVHFKALLLTAEVKLAFLLLGIAFVVNSLDFMVAQYSTTFNLDKNSLGQTRFITVNTLLLLLLTWLFQHQLLLVQYTAILVIGLIFYIALNTSVLKLKERHLLIGNLIKAGTDKR